MMLGLGIFGPDEYFLGYIDIRWSDSLRLYLMAGKTVLASQVAPDWHSLMREE